MPGSACGAWLLAVAGDYAVSVDGEVVAAVERKSLADLVATLTSGTLRYALADLAAVPRAALVVEDRWSSVFKLDRVRPAVVADGLAEAQVRFPSVPIVFWETRALAQEWTTGSSAQRSRTTTRTTTGSIATPSPLPARSRQPNRTAATRADPRDR